MKKGRKETTAEIQCRKDESNWNQLWNSRQWATRDTIKAACNVQQANDCTFSPQGWLKLLYEIHNQSILYDFGYSRNPKKGIKKRQWIAKARALTNKLTIDNLKNAQLISS